MIEFKAKGQPKIAVLLNNDVEVTFRTTKGELRELQEIADKELLITIKEFKPRRSLSQNSYFWKLIGELSQKMNLPKDEIYRNYIKSSGVFNIVPVRNDAVSSFISKWEHIGLGWFVEDLGESKLDGYTKLVTYYGSSSYNTKEMSKVVEQVIQDCEQLGINTMTLSEIALLQNENDKEEKDGR